MPTRREFLGALRGPAAAAMVGFRPDAVPRVLAALAASRADDRAPEEVARDESFWFEVQQAFEVDRSILNLNNGGVCPSPRSVMSALHRNLDLTNTAPAWALWQVLEPRKETARAGLARLFGCDPEEIAITRNASEALQILQFGLDLKRGDEVVTTNQDYPRMIATHANAYRKACLPVRLHLTLSEALVIGLLRQNVKTFFTVLGHGSTDVGEVLRLYQQAGLVKAYGVRSEIEASHAATALRWATGEKAAVITSIGPGALQALAASLAPASDGIGVWYLFGDETTEDEGFNMQQVPRHEQGLFLRLASTMGRAYSLHTSLALSTALRQGAATVDHPTRPGPFYLLLPMNTQACWLPNYNLEELPNIQPVALGPAAGDYALAAKWIHEAQRVLVKAGGGGRAAGPELIALLERADGVLVHTPIVSGCIPYSNPRNMTVGGSKGSLCGNYAMEHADLLIAVGTRAVCQSDCSRTGYPNVQRVININADVEDAAHFNHTLALVGDARRTLQRLNDAHDHGENVRKD